MQLNGTVYKDYSKFIFCLSVPQCGENPFED